MFNRHLSLLKNYGEARLIIPSWISQLNSAVQQLNDAIVIFAAEPTTMNLEAAQSAWRGAYLDFMRVNSFNFGPGGEQGLNKSITEEAGTWPSVHSLIEEQYQC